MNLQNGYKVIYEKAADGKRTFYASKSAIYPNDDDLVVASFNDADYKGKVIYEYKGDFYVSTGSIPAYDENGVPVDTKIEGFDKVFNKASVEDYVTNVPEQLPHTEAISTNGDSHGKLSVKGNVVTLNANGTIKWLTNPLGQAANWVGFKITAPEGVDPANVIITRPDGQTRVMSNILDGENFAHVYWNVTEDSRKFTYSIDWNNDGVNDLTVVINASKATLVAEEVAEA